MAARGAGAQADDVQFFDMAELGRNPAKIIPAWQKFLDTDAAAAAPLAGSVSRSGRAGAPTS